jgi:PmbA protein
VSERVDEVLGALTANAGTVAEVYLKRGRTRRYQIGAQGGEVTLTEERGWAVRAGSERASFFAAGTGLPSPAGPWPQPDGQGLRLPEPTAPARWRPPADLEAPLAGERDSLALLEGIERRLREQLPGSRLLHGELEDGSSHAELVSSLGVRAQVRRRVARLRLEVAGPGPSPATADLELAEREPRRFSPVQLAALAVARLTARAGGRTVALDRGEMLLDPPVAIAVLAGLEPLLLGRGAIARARRLRDRRGRIGSSLLTVIDDGRLPHGLLTAPVDGEGTPTREVVLVEEGAFRQPLLAWWQGDGLRCRTSGCVARPGWRDLPRPAPTHLYAKPDPRVSASGLAGAIGRGYRLVGVLGPGRFDFDGDRLAIPVCGFAIRDGRSEEPLTETWLCGGIAAFLQGIRVVADDLAFQPLGGLIGSPSLVVGGLELRGAL